VRLKSKYLGISVDDLPDTTTAKAITDSEQAIEGAKTFSRAPSLSSEPATWDDRDLATRGLVNSAEEYIERNAYTLWIHDENGINLLEFSIPRDAFKIPVAVVYAGIRIQLPIPNPIRPSCHIEYRTTFTMVPWKIPNMETGGFIIVMIRTLVTYAIQVCG
jgi:hypothetical protein